MKFGYVVQNILLNISYEEHEIRFYLQPCLFVPRSQTKISSLKQTVLSSKYIYFNTQITLKSFEIFICYSHKCPQQFSWRKYFDNRPGKIYKNSNRHEGRVNSKSGSFISVQRWASEWHQMISKNSQIKICYTWRFLGTTFMRSTSSNLAHTSHTKNNKIRQRYSNRTEIPQLCITKQNQLIKPLIQSSTALKPSLNHHPRPSNQPQHPSLTASTI